MEEYADEVERQINAKAGAVIDVGSLKLGFLLQKLKRNGGLTGGGNKFSGRNYKPVSNRTAQNLQNANLMPGAVFNPASPISVRCWSLRGNVLQLFDPQMASRYCPDYGQNNKWIQPIKQL